MTRRPRWPVTMASEALAELRRGNDCTSASSNRRSERLACRARRAKRSFHRPQRIEVGPSRASSKRARERLCEWGASIGSARWQNCDVRNIGASGWHEARAPAAHAATLPPALVRACDLEMLSRRARRQPHDARPRADAGRLEHQSARSSPAKVNDDAAGEAESPCDRAMCLPETVRRRCRSAGRRKAAARSLFRGAAGRGRVAS